MGGAAGAATARADVGREFLTGLALMLQVISDSGSAPQHTADVQRILAKAREAQCAWRELAVSARLAVIRKFRRLLADRAELVARTMAVPQRRSLGETLTAEIMPLLESCRYLERVATRALARRRRVRWWSPLWLVRTRVVVQREPLGVVLIIAPSNYPLMLPGIQSLQALVAGNAVLVKPGESGHASAHLLAELLTEAGLPAGLYTVLDESVDSARAIMAQRVDKVLLTGSANTGRAVLRQLSTTLTPAAVELSGCDAVFVCADADFWQVARALHFGLVLNGGATCIAPRRVFVPRTHLRSFEKHLRGELAGAPVIVVGAQAADQVRVLVDDALASGARVLSGRVPDAERMTPLVLTDASPEMAALQADVFAPMLCIVPVEDEEEALSFARRCPYALGATVFGGTRRARALAQRVPAGVVVVNDMIVPTADPRVPFGGYGDSGFGVTRGLEGLFELTRIKTIVMRGGRHRPHFEPISADTEELITAYLRAAYGYLYLDRLQAFAVVLRTAARLQRTRRAGEKHS